MASDSGAAPGMVDWRLAASVATRIAGQGPTVTPTEGAEIVEELREGARRSTPLVREFTGLVSEEGTAPVLVVDRGGWAQANVEGFAEVIAPVVSKLQQRKGASTGGLTDAIGSRVTGIEIGTMLGFLAGRVLGQFDPFYAPPGTSDVGRLLLVAPNIVHAERELKADPSDFRLWVCLHEETHRVQFTAVPWMRDHLRGELMTLVGDLDLEPGRVAGMLGDVVRRTGDIVAGRGDGSLLDLFATPAQREVIERVTAVMSLLEGHADVVMDDVGPEVIPTVGAIRASFNQRRKGAGSLDRLFRRLLGLEAKMAQYRDGAAFVRGVLDRVGMEGFNKVWVEPANLPTKAEIADPLSWVRRVHG